MNSSAKSTSMVNKCGEVNFLKAIRSKWKTHSDVSISNPSPLYVRQPGIISTQLRNVGVNTDVENTSYLQRDDVIQQNMQMVKKIQQLEEQLELVTSYRPSTTQTGNSETTQNNTYVQTSSKKLPWNEACVANIRTKRNIFSPAKCWSYDEVSIDELLENVVNDGGKKFNRKSTIASIYCFTENVNICLSFVYEIKGKLILSDGLAKLLPGKPRSLSVEIWSQLPTVTINSTFELKTITTKQGNIILILNGKNLITDIETIFMILDNHAKTQKNLTLGVDSFEFSNHNIRYIDMLSLIHSTKYLRYCFYYKRNPLDFFIITDHIGSSSRISMSLGDLHRPVLNWDSKKLKGENENFRKTMDKNKKFEMKEGHAPIKPKELDHILAKTTQIEKLMLKLQDKVSDTLVANSSKTTQSLPTSSKNNIEWLTDTDYYYHHFE